MREGSRGRDKGEAGWDLCTGSILEGVMDFRVFAREGVVDAKFSLVFNQVDYQDRGR